MENIEIKGMAVLCGAICATTLLPAFAADALTPLAEEIAGFDAACPGEKIVATVNPIFVTPRVDASIVRVASARLAFMTETLGNGGI